MGRYRLNDIAATKLEMLGEEGARWLAALDDTVDGFAAAWGFTVGENLDSGSHAFVATARLHSGEDAVFKLCLPDMRGAGETLKELHVMVAAQGHGYARVFRHDFDRRAILMERLGAELDVSGLSVEEQIDVICRTLSPWVPLPAGLAIAIETGAEKAEWLRVNIEQMWEETARPCSEAAVRQAQAFALRRIAAHDPSTAVLVHGDAHQHNTLLAADGTYRLIDPDPLIAEPAADLSVPMRDWNQHLLDSGDPLAAAAARCHRIAALTGVAPQAIWEWGFMERVSTALYCHTLGILEWSEPAYEVIAACVGAAECPPR
jgi:streptomycin 6-kinase